jgi:hypothetical protein
MKIDLTPSQAAMVREALRSYADGLTVNQWLAEAREYLMLLDKLYPQEQEVECANAEAE